MNHNNVISLPIKPSTTLATGTIVEMNSDGNAVKPAAANRAIGVVLHDAKEPDSKAPVAIQLFSSGGIVFVMSGAAHVVGAIVTVGATSGKTAAGAGTIGVTNFLVMDVATATDELIRCIILNG